jgi:hypothetical protein
MAKAKCIHQWQVELPIKWGDKEMHFYCVKCGKKKEKKIK